MNMPSFTELCVCETWGDPGGLNERERKRPNAKWKRWLQMLNPKWEIGGIGSTIAFIAFCAQEKFLRSFYNSVAGKGGGLKRIGLKSGTRVPPTKNTCGVCLQPKTLCSPWVCLQPKGLRCAVFTVAGKGKAFALAEKHLPLAELWVVLRLAVFVCSVLYRLLEDLTIVDVGISAMWGWPCVVESVHVVWSRSWLRSWWSWQRQSPTM